MGTYIKISDFGNFESVIFKPSRSMLFVAILFTILVLMTITCFTASIVIIKYINSKPTGLQTLLDKFTIKLCYSLMLFELALTFQSSSFFMTSFQPRVAQLLFYWQSFVCNYYYAWYIALILVKYLSVFHPNLVEFELTDSEVANRTNMAIIVLLCSVIGIEQGIISDYRDFTLYQSLSCEFSDDGEKGIGMTKLTVILQILEIFFAIFTYSRIQRHFANVTEKQDTQDENETKNEIKIVRIAVVLIIILIPLCMFIFTKIDLSSCYNSGLLGVVIIFLYAVLPPVLYIHRSNDQMKEFVCNCLKPAFFQ